MSYFGGASAEDRRLSVVGDAHLKKDVGFVEAFTAQRKNTYGMFEEQATTAQASADLGRWISSQAGDRFTNPRSPEFTNDPIRALTTLRSEGLEIPDEFDFADEGELTSRAIEVEAEKFRERSKIVERATGAGRAGALAGGLVGGMDDLENIATLPLGASGRVGIAMTALIEGGVNAGIEGVAHKPRQDFLKKLGVESDQTLVQSIAEGFIGGAIIGGGIRAVTGPEIYQAGGRAINSLGLRRTAKVLQKADEPTAFVQGHVIEDELNAIDVQKQISRKERGSLDDDADFLNDVQARRDLNERADSAELAANEGRIPLIVRTSDEMLHEIEVAESVARTARLVERYELGEAISLREATDLELPLNVNSTQRNIIEYYDLMDARFRGQEVPDEFEIVETSGFDASRREAKFEAELTESIRQRAEAAKERKAQAAAIKKVSERTARRVEKSVRDEKLVERGLNKYPIINSLKERGGVDPKSPIGQELKAMGLTPKTHRGLFRNGGLKDIDNLDYLERGDLVEQDGYYFDRQDILNAISEEVSGSPRRSAFERDAEDAAEAARTEVEAIRESAQGQIASAEVDIEDAYTGIIADLEQITVMTEDGGFKSVSAQEVVRELIEDEDFAEQIKLCGLRS